MRVILRAREKDVCIYFSPTKITAHERGEAKIKNAGRKTLRYDATGEKLHLYDTCLIKSQSSLNSE